MQIVQSQHFLRKVVPVSAIAFELRVFSCSDVQYRKAATRISAIRRCWHCPMAKHKYSKQNMGTRRNRSPCSPQAGQRSLQHRSCIPTNRAMGSPTPMAPSLSSAASPHNRRHHLSPSSVVIGVVSAFTRIGLFIHVDFDVLLSEFLLLLLLTGKLVRLGQVLLQ